MSEKQKNARPKIEDVINDVLCRDTLKNAEDFIAFLRANKMSPRWASTNSWVVLHKKQHICYIRISGAAHYHNLGSGSWHISYVNYGHTNLVGYTYEHWPNMTDEDFKAMIWNNIKNCRKCYNCTPGNSVTVLGKQFNNVCHSWLTIKNPDIDTLTCAKKIVIMRKNAIIRKDEQKIENIINDALKGDARENALKFAEFLKANEMIFTGIHSEVHYKDKCACYVYIDTSGKEHSSWSVFTEGDYINEHDDVPLSERMKEIAWANVCRCRSCGATQNCSPGRQRMILGKEFDNVCNVDMRFTNPSAETLECIEKLVTMRKYAIDDMEMA